MRGRALRHLAIGGEDSAAEAPTYAEMKRIRRAQRNVKR
jgi:hypothetical protein